ncbi:MAG: twitching motility protein PilT, partial [Chloroflexota bacterium]
MPNRVTVTLHGDLVDFLPAPWRSSSPGSLERAFDGHPSVKDALEALGVPHPEIAALTVNGTPAGFGQRLNDGDRVEAWPAAEAAAR